MVTNLDTGRSVEVRINDRGPFVPDRILDVSYGAGKALGMIGPGVIPVRIAVTKAPTGEGSAPIASVRFTVQAGSFASVENARLLQRSLAETFSHVEVIPRTVGSETVFRVWVGDFRRRVDAQAVAERLAGRGLSVLVVERNR